MLLLYFYFLLSASFKALVNYINFKHMKGKYKKPNKVPLKYHKKHEIPPPPPPPPPPPLIKKKLELKEIRNQ